MVQGLLDGGAADAQGLSCVDDAQQLSESSRTREERPERRTDVPYRSSSRRFAAGFPLCDRAMPVGRSAIMALFRADILERILGMLPSTDLIMPTCSALVEKSRR